MPDINVDNIAQPEPKRDRWGRYIIPDPKNNPTPYTRATTIAGTIEDRHHLEQWQQRMVAYGLAQRPDLLALATTHNPTDDKTTYNDITQKAMETAKAGAAAAHGTALHRATQMLDSGTPLEQIPTQFHERLTTYRNKLNDTGIQIHPAGIEQIIALDGWKIAGTADRLPVTLPDNRRVVADLKTGKLADYSWLSISIQLAIYANHDTTYNPATDTRGPRIDVDRDEALIIHLPANEGPCQLHLIDIRQGWDYLITAMDVREHRRNATKTARPYQPTSTGQTLGDWIRTRIQTLAGNPAAVTDLRNRWPNTVPQPFPTNPTTTQIDDIAEVLSRVERTHQIGFPPARPGTQPTKEKPTT